ncbi:MAG: DUF3102 domain-containing protein [Peptococcaceae bacterium]|nr:DUF3102 domain-containing protein [Peptococcaceae bacterium]
MEEVKVVELEEAKGVERTPQVIAAEILAIKSQARKILLTSAIEVGRRLAEAKAIIPHGEWLQWLEQSVGYSCRTAENLMRLYEAYGQKQEGLANSQTFANLSYSQAVVLLGLPEAEREQFILEQDVENMTVRQLEKAIQERREALEKDSQVKAAAKEEEKEEENLKKAIQEQEQKMAKLVQERDQLKKKMEVLSKSQAEAEERAVRLSLQLKSMEQDTNAQALARMSRNLHAAYNRAKANKIAFLYELIEQNLKDFFREIKDLAAKEPETYEIYREKMIKLLTDGLREKL